MNTRIAIAAFSKTVSHCSARRAVYPLTRSAVMCRKPMALPTTAVRSFSTVLPKRQAADNVQKEASVHKVCWNCNHMASKAAVHCENQDCGVIQAVSPDVNFFELLGAGAGPHKDQPSFDVDVKSLRRNFLKLQQTAHPDSFSQASQREHKYAEIQSSIINKAYNTLKNPLARAQYLLAMRGVEVEESESLHNPELLMEVMEVREALEEAANDEEVEQIKQENDVKLQETAQHLSQAFNNNDYDVAKDYMIQLQYWENIRQAIVDWSPGKRVELNH